MFLRSVLPKHHLEPETKDVVKLGMGLVGTMAALILGLLVASAKGNHDAQSAELTQASANILMLDRVLSHYGPETNEVREALKGAVVHALDKMWSQSRRGPSQADSGPHGNESLYEKIHALSPKDEAQRSLKSEALTIALSLGQTRWLLYEQQATSASKPMVIVMVFWLTIIFVSWGLFAPTNGTVIATFLAAGLAVSGAIFLILDMYTPYTGLIQVSSAPLRAALAQLGQ
jgi:hypothetical protein